MLLVVATNSKSDVRDALKATAASAIARLSRHSPSLIHALVEKYLCITFITTLSNQ